MKNALVYLAAIIALGTANTVLSMEASTEPASGRNGDHLGLMYMQFRQYLAAKANNETLDAFARETIEILDIIELGTANTVLSMEASTEPASGRNRDHLGLMYMQFRQYLATINNNEPLENFIGKTSEILDVEILLPQLDNQALLDNQAQRDDQGAEPFAENPFQHPMLDFIINSTPQVIRSRNPNNAPGIIQNLRSYLENELTSAQEALLKVIYSKTLDQSEPNTFPAVTLSARGKEVLASFPVFIRIALRELIIKTPNYSESQLKLLSKLLAAWNNNKQIQLTPDEVYYFRNDLNKRWQEVFNPHVL